jgi:L-ribulose-5-phosphate 3-epimerase
MRIAGHDVGVCSWSLRAADMRELVETVRELGLSHVQLALGPLVFLDDKRKHFELGQLRGSGLTITAGMIGFPGEDYSTIPRIRATGGFVPDDAWTLRRRLTIEAAKLAQELEVKILTTHAGFIPPSNHVDYPKLLSRVGELAKALADLNVALAMETGQEGASELLQFLNDLPSGNVGVNFDPANMILYGQGDEIQAVKTLDRHIRHVHVKDAVESEKPGIEWGKEVAVGAGDVDLPGFVLALDQAGYGGPLVIERETSGRGLDEIRSAIDALRGN